MRQTAFAASYCRIVLINIVLLFSVNLFSQNNFLKGKIFNEFTKEPFSFASIHWQKAKHGVTADSVGNFLLRKSQFNYDTLVVGYVGYNNFFKPFNALKDTGEIIIYLPDAKMNAGVSVKTKFNKGLRWWKNVVANKEKNNPFNIDNYSYELYNKLELDLNNLQKNSFHKIKLLKPFEFLLNNVDSVSEAKPFLPVFLTESISDYYASNNPQKIREVIKAVQTNGIKNETVLQFVGGISQKFNTYNNLCNLFGKEFINPMSSNGDKYYNYKGADTQIIAGEKYFHLYFSPKQVGENTFNGDCWIHSTNWGIQKITLNTSPTANINFVNRLIVVQEFALTADKHWVFAKDKVVADLSPFKKDKISFIGRKLAQYKNVQINQASIHAALAKNTQKQEVIINDDALTQDKTYWNNNRHDSLTKNELSVYKMIDTLKQMPLFKKYANTLAFITDGHKKFGKIEIGPWYRWISGNQLEKLRLRFDVGTTTEFSKQLRVHTYLAYGFNDQRLKGKFDITYKLPNKSGITVSASYLNDLDNGNNKHLNNDGTMDNMFSQIIRRHGIVQKFLGLKEVKFSVLKQWQNSFSVQAIFNRTDFETFQPLPKRRVFTFTEDEIINTEIGLKLRYAPGEKRVTTHRRERKIRTNLPVIELYYGKGLPNVFRSEYRYQKVHFSTTQSVRIPKFGKIHYAVYAGKIFGNNIPFMLLETHPGNEIYYYNKNAFSLMNRFEYVSDQYYGLNFEHNIEKKLLNLLPFMRKSKVRQFYTIKTVRGSVNDANKKFNKTEFGGYHLRSLRGSYYTEVGTGIDNIFKFFRIDAVWRFAPPLVNAANPILNSTHHNFGIFGSFQLQF